VSTINGAIAVRPVHRWTIREVWFSWDETQGDRGPHTQNVIPIFDNNTAAGRVKPAMELHNPILICVVDCAQHIWCGNAYE